MRKLVTRTAKSFAIMAFCRLGAAHRMTHPVGTRLPVAIA
jgi:hypothetical protein